MAYGYVASDAKYCNECCEIKELEMPSSTIGHPDVGFLSRFHPRPTWERIPCPVRSSVPRPMTKPSIARRPFHCSAKNEKPNFESLIWVKKSEETVTDHCAFRSACFSVLLLPIFRKQDAPFLVLFAKGLLQVISRERVRLPCKQSVPFQACIHTVFLSGGAAKRYLLGAS